MVDRSSPAEGAEETAGSDGPPPADADVPREGPLEPGSPSIENAVFVLLGVATTLVVLLSLVP